jgi:hypothetical protein
MTPSRERTIGRKILADPILREALERYAEADCRTVPDAACTIVRRALVAAGWLARLPGRGLAAGVLLEEHRRASVPDSADLAVVVPMVRPTRAGVRS